ncbi:hypothetical protein SCP_1005190 [Sparassis crispa]|uniref:Uncharacterized protein n=1 Tax=Sparassis crispa TaxID=139825 RepID=A0A401GYP1_9APHY|nr:hypothetical protein SCP_1005190 [Sparassis crispa]GBE87272.1 hypothetical protein SCP_1005190 [Sparassis crispa]
MHVFSASVFEPAADEVRRTTLLAEEVGRFARPESSRLPSKTSSDEDLPDIAQLQVRECNKEGKGKRVVSNDSDAAYDAHAAKGKSKKATRTNKRKWKGRWDSNDDAPREVSGDSIALWNRRDNDMPGHRFYAYEVVSVTQ